MKHLMFAAALSSALLAGACAKSETADKAGRSEPAAADTAAIEAKLPTATVDEVDQAIARGEFQAVDANGAGTRKKMGVVPGAILLTDSEDFKPTELPADKSKGLVFYCANTHCGASHTAAAKAMTAGYTKVKVMPEGIAGWVKAGKKTQQL
jgi:rhodanese-related sulfurtransferase